MAIEMRHRYATPVLVRLMADIVLGLRGDNAAIHAESGDYGPVSESAIIPPPQMVAQIV